MNLNKLIFWWSLRKGNLNFSTAILAPANSKVSSFHFRLCSYIAGHFIVFRIFFTEMKVSSSIYADRSYNKHFCLCSPTSTYKGQKNCSFIVFHNAFRDNFAFQVNFLFFGEQKMGRGGRSVWLIYLNVTIVIAYIHLGETSYPILPVYEKLTYYL